MIIYVLIINYFIYWWIFILYLAVYDRKDSCYDFDFFSCHGVSVLEDLVISMADGVASMYVELISVDGNMSDGIHSLGLSLCTLSTRALQRLRNEVHHNLQKK